MPGRRSLRSRVVGPGGSAATLGMAAGSVVAYRRLASAPHRSALVERMCAMSIRAGPERRKRAIASARGLARWDRQPVEKSLEFRFIDFNEIPAIECIGSGLDLLPERL